MEVHPLQDSKILKKIFSFRPNTRDTVKIHRLVCKAWEEASFSQWQQHFFPLIVFQDSRHGMLGKYITSMCQVIQDNQMNQATATTLPHKNFTLLRWTIDVDHSDTSSDDSVAGLTRLFWSLIGHNIATLTISYSEIPYSFTLLPPVLWRALPNLDNLTLGFCKMEIKKYNHFVRAATREQEQEIGIKIAQQTLILDGLTKRMEQPDEAENCAMLSCQRQKVVNNLEILKVELDQLKGMDTETTSVLELRRRRKIRAEIIKKKLQKDFDILSNTSVKLKRVQIQSLFVGPCPDRIGWPGLVNSFPNLESIQVCHSCFEYLGASDDKCTATRRLKKIDVMGTDKLQPFISDMGFLMLPTEKLTFDCGFKTSLSDLQCVLKRQADGLEKLVIFRAPFGVPHENFLDGIMMPNLTKLHLWGNVSENLDFLKFTPNLKTLKWNTTCYDRETGGALLHGHLGEKALVMSAENIVTSATGLDADFKLESLETLEMVSGALSLSSVKKMGKWFPNVTAFKAVVIGENEMIQIGAQWRNMESLELAHGSFVWAAAILHVCRILKGFQKLKSFAWRPCSCERRVFGMTEMSAVIDLKNTAGDNVVHAWKIKQEMPNDCPEALFEKALEGGENVDIYIRAICPDLKLWPWSKKPSGQI